MQTGNSDYKVVFSNYERHHADQLKSVLEILKKFDEKMPAQKVRVCLTGSGAKPIAESLGVPFAQEVAANAIALQKKYEKVGTAIELGGQDAKMIFFKESETDHMRSVSDMRMNGRDVYKRQVLIWTGGQYYGKLSCFLYIFTDFCSCLFQFCIKTLLCRISCFYGC